MQIWHRLLLVTGYQQVLALKTQCKGSKVPSFSSQSADKESHPVSVLCLASGQATHHIHFLHTSHPTKSFTGTVTEPEVSMHTADAIHIRAQQKAERYQLIFINTHWTWVVVGAFP